jgi:hypothetical protein
MEKNTNATAQLLLAVQEANQAMVEGIIAAQEGNVKLAQRIMSNWIATLKGQRENAQTLSRGMEQQMIKQQEAVLRIVQQMLELYSDSLRASYSPFESSLRLSENLQNCLRALASRYPHHIVDINEQVLGPLCLGTSGWKAADLIELFQSIDPGLLQAKARLEVNTANSGIYVLERSEVMPALWIHSGKPRKEVSLSIGIVNLVV